MMTVDDHGGLLLFVESQWMITVDCFFEVSMRAIITTIVFHILVTMHGYPFLHF
ncbi:hypothetical protein Hanom_Chr01g00041601 [Helianthus anomalus]